MLNIDEIKIFANKAFVRRRHLLFLLCLIINYICSIVIIKVKDLYYLYL